MKPRVVCLVLIAMACTSLTARAGEPNANAISYATATNPMTIVLDARDASRGLMHTQLTIPIAPGPFTFVYPKWIPGEHGPTGPLNDLAALRVSANGESLPWIRDTIDLYAFHVTVPANVRTIDVDFEVLLNAPDDKKASDHIADVNWNRDLVYQEDTNSHDVYVKPSIILPADWDFATALPVLQRNGQRVEFAEVALNTLVDSPLYCGRYARHIPLWSNGPSIVEFDLFADAPENLDLTPQQIAPYRRMVPEALAMYGSRHWNNYHVLGSLSDNIQGGGIEHHESSDDSMPPDFLTNEQWILQGGDYIPHEFSHSWNGKYRRPADLTTPNFQVPMQTDLLWVYEGLNQYLGDVLSFRMGLRSAKLFPDFIAANYAFLDAEPGRLEDPLIDTTIAAPYLYEAKGDYNSLRRTAGDFYSEGELVWLDVDTIIREQTGGKKSLDDFLYAYAGPPDTGPTVVTYTRNDIEDLLNGVTPYDWHALFQRYVYKISVHPPSDELARAGWRLTYTAEPNAFDEADDAVGHSISAWWYSVGLDLDSDGKVTDVRQGSPAWRAGIAPNMKIVAVNERAFNAGRLDPTLTVAQRSRQPIVLLINYEDWYRTYEINYHGGPRHPHLVRIADKPDMLAKIVAPRTSSR